MKLRVSCLAINADFNQKKVIFVIMYVTGSTGKTEDRSKFLMTLDLFKKHKITTAFMKKKKRGILHLYSKIN